MVTKEYLLNLIEPYFNDCLTLDDYKIQTIKPTKLLSYARLDLAFKLIYIEFKSFTFAQKIYKEHIRAFSFGKFNELGNDKNSIEDYITGFDETFADIQKNGFDSDKSLILLSNNGIIANGAHRITSAIYLNKSVECVQIDMKDRIYDYNFFYKRNVPNNMLDIAVSKFIEYSDNSYIACIWPTAQGGCKQIEKLIPNIIYKKNIVLNVNGAHNFLSQIYYGEEWLGDVGNNFKGSLGKLVKTFKTFDPVRVTAFQADNLNEVLKIKEKIREIFNISKHSIHITDTKKETERVSRMVFNDNSIHFLNHAKPNQYSSTHKKIIKFKKFITENKLNCNDVVLDGGMVLSVYGLRQSNDIDYFIDNNEKVKYSDSELDNHDDELKYHSEKKLDLIYDPKFYFYFNDLKFIAFEQLYKMKKNRGEAKDINDHKMMSALITNNKLKQIIIRFKQNILYYRKMYKKQIRFFYNSVFLFIFIYLIARFFK